jgi:hypothetical protein
MRHRFGFTSSLQHICCNLQPPIELNELFACGLNIKNSQMQLAQHDLHCGQVHRLIFLAAFEPTEEAFPLTAIWTAINATFNPTHD